MTDKNKVLIMILAGSIIGGSVSAVTKIGFLQIPPYTFTLIRFLIATMAMLPLLPKIKFSVDGNFVSLLIISLLPVLNVVLYVSGLKLTTANIATMLYAATPILTSFFSAYLINHKMPLKKWFSVVLGLFGASFVILLPLIEKGSPFSGNLIGNLLIFTGVILWSLYLPFSKKMQNIFPPVLITFCFIVEATFIFLLLSLIEMGASGPWWTEIKLPSIIALLYISLFATVGGYLLSQYKVKLSGPLAAALNHYLMPVFGFLFAFVLLGEKLTMGLILGSAIVFLSIWLTLYKS